MIQIVTGDARPIFRQIVDGIQLKIVTGELAVGDKLPSVRGLARQLTINPNTVARAYNELLSLGIVESRMGLGFFVRQKRQVFSREERTRRLKEAVDQLVHDIVGLGFPPEQILKRVSVALAKVHGNRKTGTDS